MDKVKPILSELLRPQQLSDLTLPKRDVTRLQRMVQRGDPMNLLFYGSPGTGKTSAARIIIDATGCEAITVIASKTPLEGIMGFASTVSWTRDKAKLCFIDEADALSRREQTTLRPIIENHRHCRFILAVNNIRTMSEALKSRLNLISFDIAPEEESEAIRRVMERYEQLLRTLAITYDTTSLRKIVGIYFPDFRAIANKIEYEFA
jgi:replication-associated recombination protein RarA